MATKQIKKLSDLQKITTATGDQMIPVVDASGNVNPIKLTDLAQVVAGLMPNVSLNNNGFASIDNYKFLLHDFKIGNTLNAIFLGSVSTSYNRIFFNLLISDPLQENISQLSIYINSGNIDDNRIKVTFNTYGFKNSNVHFLYKFENKTYKYYLYYSKKMSGNILDVVLYPITNETRAIKIEDITEFEEINI